MKVYWLLGLTVLSLISISLNGCARIPMRVDQSTLQKYEKVYEGQAEKNNHPLLGVWRVTFAANKKTISPNDGYYSTGEVIFIAIRRGSIIDFICASYFGDFGTMSDQGPTHTVNLNGSTFWSFNEQIPENDMYRGKLIGILGSRGKAEAILSSDKSNLIIYEYPEPADGSTNEDPRIITTTKIIGGPIMKNLDKGTVSTIFFERRPIQ